MRTDRKEHAGAPLFYFCLFIASCLLLRQAVQIRGFGQASGPATVPVIATGLMVLTALVTLVGSLLGRTAKLLPASAEFGEILPLRILGYMAFCAVFVSLIEILGFWTSTAGFLTVSFLWLQRSGIVKAALITAGTLVVVYLVFVFLFKVYLP